MRQVILDTETTGIDPAQGHRVIEIGCVELLERKLTGNHYHVYLNPQRVIEEEAIQVHGITNAFLEDKPSFADIVDDFLAFIEGATLVIHNAPFDLGFLDHELTLLGHKQSTIKDQYPIIDTLAMARNKHPGQKNHLDALCKRYHIDNAARTLHGALLDAEILAEVYLAMTGGQATLSLGDGLNETGKDREALTVHPLPADRPPLTVLEASTEEIRAHQQQLVAIKQAAGVCLWMADETIAVLSGK